MLRQEYAYDRLHNTGGYPGPEANRPTGVPATQRERHGKAPRPHEVIDPPCRFGRESVAWPQPSSGIVLCAC